MAVIMLLEPNEDTTTNYDPPNDSWSCDREQNSSAIRTLKILPLSYNPPEVKDSLSRFPPTHPPDRGAGLLKTSIQMRSERPSSPMSFENLEREEEALTDLISRVYKL